MEWNNRCTENRNQRVKNVMEENLQNFNLKLWGDLADHSLIVFTLLFP